eukprot:scaffold239997_cov22-Prasinocladus_malaysianus.AAC.1
MGIGDCACKLCVHYARLLLKPVPPNTCLFSWSSDSFYSIGGAIAMSIMTFQLNVEMPAYNPVTSSIRLYVVSSTPMIMYRGMKAALLNKAMGATQQRRLVSRTSIQHTILLHPADTVIDSGSVAAGTGAKLFWR